MGDQGHRGVVGRGLAAHPAGSEGRSQVSHQGERLGVGVIRRGDHPGAGDEQVAHAGLHAGLGGAGHGMAGHEAAGLPLPAQPPQRRRPHRQQRPLDRAHIGSAPPRGAEPAAGLAAAPAADPGAAPAPPDRSLLKTEGSVLTTEASPRSRALVAVASRRTRARTSAPAVCRSRPSDPPIKPRPTTPTGPWHQAGRGSVGLVIVAAAGSDQLPTIRPCWKPWPINS